MRHENVSTARIAAAAWPSTMDGLVLAEPADIETRANHDDAVSAMPCPAAPDVPAGVGGLIVAAYASIILVFFALFAGSLLALFAIERAAPN